MRAGLKFCPEVVVGYSELCTTTDGNVATINVLALLFEGRSGLYIGAVHGSSIT